jgi:hypothetical protein
MKYFPFTVDQEFEALNGLSNLAVRVYIVLRRHMDPWLGTVGQARPISYTMLAEHCYTAIPKGAGYQRITPTRKELRVALASLERAGLLLRLNDDAPVFALKKALTATDASARSNQTGPLQGQVATPAKPCLVGVSGHTGPLHRPEPGTHINSKQKQPSTVSAASLNPSPVDNSAGQIAADFLNRLSKTLGYPILHRHGDPLLAKWVESGLTFADLEAAVLAAKAARDRDNNRAPLNPGYIAAFLPNADDWQSSWAGICAKGASLGVHPQPGEASPMYRQRVLASATTHGVTQ